MKIDYSDVVEKTMFTFFVIRFLRNYYDTPKRLPQWDNILQKTWIIVIPLFFLSTIPGLKFITGWFYEVFILVGFYLIYKAKNYRNSRMLLIAAAPVVVMTLINSFFRLITPTFYKEYEEIFASAYGFSFAWMIGFGFYAQKQNKVELVRKQKEEEERLRTEAKKQELEYQVAERTAALTQQKEELEETIAELKSTQNQLIQAEKMASLGELTAGIAHEIQNPLNFVNNFSELSIELAKELQEEFDREEMDKDLIIDLVSDLVQNQEKINHHGKRAASIVRGMLQHSRSSTGQKENTALNDLADEYLRLAYHGLRAKDKTFNADFKTEFDTRIPKIDIVPQDFGRVLLNLINNAFYAVQQKAKMGIEGYKPMVTVSTILEEEDIVIKISDNGTGIPESVKAKIFQPFFTTKPTGQGTGLGLSLAYDIVTKGHGGTLDVETQEGQGTTFIITLPTP